METSTGQTAKAILPSSLLIGMEPQWGKVPVLGEHADSVLQEFDVVTNNKK